MDRHPLRYACLVIVLAFWHLEAFPQRLTISGKAIDKETREPLPFASVGIKGKSISTITNQQGDFDFHIPVELRNDFLVVNMLGYKTYEAPVWSLLDLPTVTIEMEKSVIVLDEVVVTDSLRGSDIMEIAISRIDRNYPMEPFLLEGFYRDLKKVAGTYITLLEAAVKIYDEDYREPRTKTKLRERVALQEVRRSIGYGSQFTTYFDKENLLEVLLLNNSVRYRQFPDASIFETLVRQKDSYYDQQEVFVLTHADAQTELTVYIEKSSYAIIHLELVEKTNEALKRKRGLQSRLVSNKRVNDFKRFEGKFYLNYISLDSKVNWYDAKTRELRFETEVIQSLLINEVFPNTSRRILAREKMKTYGLQYQDPPYNKTFWDNYNIIKESPLDRKIIEDLEKRGPLEKQFKNN
jgi:hypothetical protein